MGYYTRFTGAINMEPPLAWEEFKDEPWGKEDADLVIYVEVEDIETNEGLKLVKTGTAIVPVMEDGYKGYYVMDTLEAIVKAYPDRTFTGEIRGEGESAGDISRYLVIDGKAVRWQAEIKWPDGVEASR